MKHDFLDHHRSGNSFVHRADPRLKLFMMLCYILTVVALPFSLAGYYLVLAWIPVLLAVASGVSFFHFVSKLLKIYPMIFFITFLLPFFPGGESPAVQVGVVKIYQSGLQKFILINIKSVLAVFISIVLTTTIDFSLLLKAMEKLKLPKLMIAVLSFMYRFIFLLIDETERMMMAYQSRYIRLPLLMRMKIVARQIGVLFLRTYERGERVYQAMDSRGFNGTVYTLSDLHWKRPDSLLALLFGFLLLIPFFIF